MITILCAPGTESVGDRLSQAIATAYAVAGPPHIVARDGTWPGTSAWDDILILVYGAEPLPDLATKYVEQFRLAHPVTDPATGHSRPGGFVVPVATDPTVLKPPPPVSLIKAALYTGAASDAIIVRVVGVLLGLALRPGEHQIFIAYRAADGMEIAKGLHRRLTEAGLQAWLDEAPGNLEIGQDVQERIRRQLTTSCAMLLVVDTPRATDSAWMAEEITVALGELIPILPVVTGPEQDLSRFLPLASLQRRVPLKGSGPDGQPLSDDEWTRVHRELEHLFLITYQRREAILWHAERAFVRHGFAWSSVDERRRMYEARRLRAGGAPGRVVLSHCSVHDPTYVPALRAYAQYIARFPDIAAVNDKLCVYDRPTVLSSAEVDMVWRELHGPEFTLVHYNELGVLIASNFTVIR